MPLIASELFKRNSSIFTHPTLFFNFVIAPTRFDVLYPLSNLKSFINFYERLFQWDRRLTKNFPRQLFSKPKIVITSSSKDLPKSHLFSIKSEEVFNKNTEMAEKQMAKYYYA